jgi:hypothetical protein
MSQEQFEVWLNSSSDENPRDMIMNSENDYIGIIWKTSVGYQFSESSIYKISGIGDTLSIKFVKQDTNLILDKIIQVNESPIEYIICGTGYHIDSSANHWFSYFSKIDNNLNIIWEKIYHLHNIHNNYYHPFYSKLLKKTTGGYLHANALYPNWQMFFFEFDEQGDSVNYRMYEGDSSGIVTGLTYNYDSTAYWVHTSGGQHEPNPPECQCVELNLQLDHVKVMNYPRYFGFDYTAKLLPSGNLVAASVFRNPWIPEEYVAAFKFDSAFSILGECKITSPDTANQRGLKSLDFVYQSDIYFGGTHNFQMGTWVPGPSWIVIGRLNEDFELNNELYIGGDATYKLTTITATADSGVLITGTWYDYESQSYERDVIIMKLTKNNLITGNIENIFANISSVILYPNPGIDILNIRTTHFDSYFTLWDENGRLVTTQKLNSKITTINTSNLTAGNYYWKVTKDNHTIDQGIWICGI